MININPIYGEDYETQWGIIDYDNKVVLDIGGSNGDTADFFLSKGARLVISVDNDLNHHLACKENAKKFKLPILAIFTDAGCSKAFDTFLKWFEPDVVKSDCEGCEKVLFTANENYLKIPKEYIIEVHSEYLEQNIRERLARAGFELRFINAWADPIKILYWINGAIQ